MDFFVVTGASKGIGKAIAEELASIGKNLILVARSEDILKEMTVDFFEKYNVVVKYFSLDLTLPESVTEISQFLVLHNHEVEGLVNNAGFGIFGRFDQIDIAKTKAMLYLNLNLVVELSHALIHLRNKNKKFYILNIASTAAFQPVPYFSIYSASKSFVLFFSRALKEEMKEVNVSISCLCPGPTDTSFFNKAKANEGVLSSDWIKMSAGKVAKSGLKGMLREKGIIVPGFQNKLNYFGAKFLPVSWILKLIEIVLRPKN
jgi:uncharacterized protein